MNEKLTQSETALIEEAIRPEALLQLKKYGLPTKKIEAWHYTDLRASLNFRKNETSKTELAKKKLNKKKLSQFNAQINFLFENGNLTTQPKLPQGITAQPLEQTQLTKKENSFATDERANAIAWINNAYATGGLNIKIEKSFSDIICLSHLSNNHCAYRHQINFANNVKATFIDCHAGSDDFAYLSSTIIDITAGDNAEIFWVIDEKEGKAADYLARLNLQIGKNTIFKILIINSGGRLVRQELNCQLIGEGGNLEIYAANLIGGDSHIDITSCIYHRAPQTRSREFLRNIATENGRGVFQGQIKVEQKAQLTDAQMACNTLLLSDTCEFSTKPELEIFADDVQCAHGATLFDLEPAHLFYLTARGIEKNEARKLLVRAFIVSLLDELDNENLIKNFNNTIDEWLQSHA